MSETNMKIQELVAKIERGEIRLPEMQRSYVWQKTRVRDLLDSLYRGYPSGSILIWETGEDVPTREFSVAQEAKSQSKFQLLLDGQQRLTSLSAILRGDPVRVRGLKKPIDILFNLEHPDALESVTEVDDHTSINTDADDEGTEDASENELRDRFEKMTFVVHNKMLESVPHWVSVTDVFRENSTTSQIIRKAGVTSMDDPKFNKYEARITQLRNIKNYNYHVHILGHDKSYEEVAEIFVRVNSLGAKLRSSDLALAQITSKWNDSLKIFQAYDEAWKNDGFDLDQSIYLKNLMAFATGQSSFNTINRLSESTLKDSWERAKTAWRIR